MPSKKIVNPSFQHLRRWLFPGVQWNDAPPDVVSRDLVNVVDIEHWVPVPRFFATITSPAPGAATTATVNFENFVRSPVISGNLGTAKPTRFMITDLKIRQLLNQNSNCFMATRTRTTAPSFLYPDFPNNPSQATLGVNIWSGKSEPFAQLWSGDQGAAGTGTVLYTAGDVSTWISFPDLAPGNGILFMGGIQNMNLQLEISWAERREEGENNVIA